MEDSTWSGRCELCGAAPGFGRRSRPASIWWELPLVRATQPAATQPPTLRNSPGTLPHELSQGLNIGTRKALRQWVQWIYVRCQAITLPGIPWPNGAVLCGPSAQEGLGENGSAYDPMPLVGVVS